MKTTRKKIYSEHCLQKTEITKNTTKDQQDGANSIHETNAHTRMPGDGPIMPGDGPIMPGDGPLMA